MVPFVGGRTAGRVRRHRGFPERPEVHGPQGASWKGRSAAPSVNRKVPEPSVRRYHPAWLGDLLTPAQDPSPQGPPTPAGTRTGMHRRTRPAGSGGRARTSPARLGGPHQGEGSRPRRAPSAGRPQALQLNAFLASEIKTKHFLLFKESPIFWIFFKLIQWDRQ